MGVEIKVDEKVVIPQVKEEKDFTCGLCYHPLSRPCKLPCGHFFDTNCLTKYHATSQERTWVGNNKGNMGY